MTSRKKLSVTSRNISPSLYHAHSVFFDKIIAQNRRLKKALKKDNSLCLWFSKKNVDEYLGMLAAVAHLDGKGIVFYLGDCTEICDALACIQLEEDIPTVERQLLSSSDKAALLKEWERIRSENSPLRIIKDGEVISLPADHIDDVIFSIIGDDEVKATYIFEHFPWDAYPVMVTFINYRLRQLIAQGKIDVVKEGWDTDGFYGAPAKSFLKNIIRNHKD